MFSFEKMLAWQKAADWSDPVLGVADSLPPRLQSSFGDQLRRACLSVTNNLAEGSGKLTSPSQRTYYDTAHGSAYETMSILAILRRCGNVSQETHQTLYQQGDEVASLIYRLMQATLDDKTFREDGTEYDASHDG